MAAEQPSNKALPIAGGMLASMLALLLGLVRTFEGSSAQPYRGVCGKRTGCYGHTEKVEQRTYTRAECSACSSRTLVSPGTPFRAASRCRWRTTRQPH